MQLLGAEGLSESACFFCRAAATVAKLDLAGLQVLERKGLTHVPSAFCLKDVFQVWCWSLSVE